ncbi:transposase, partial [Escherichia coli]|uniref:transposase n=1 Tax=Escherichia coli TaxID=562 RepID=UPI00391F9F87
LRIHCMQHWYNLSDGAMEDALYEIASMRLFARLSLDSALPDRTTIMNFRHLLEQHQLARQLFKTINRWLAEQNGHQHRIHESQHPCQGGAPVSHHQAAVRLRESQIQGAAEKR